MNSIIETLNHSGGTFLDFAWPIAWQSGLLIAALLAFDFLFRRKVRASVRYAVWLVVLVKLILPPTLALPTSPAWWLLHQPPVIEIKPQMQNYTVSYDDESLPPASLNSLPAYVPPKPVMTPAAWLLALSAATSTGLLAWLLIRWWQITRRVSRAKTSERLTAIATQTRLLAGVRACPPVKLTADTMSPAVCGLFRPAILIPQTLAENFSDEQLRAVLLHELIHLRRRDVWLNFLQSLLQIVYWWHPLVWLANSRIRRVREEAVDDAVMLALAGGAEAYAPTLLQVAKLALNRPLVSLGLVGIMESRSALRQRIERLVDFRPPRRAGLTLVSALGILAFTAVAVPMGGAPGVVEEQVLPASVAPVSAVTAPDTNRPPILIEAQIYQLRAVDFEKAVSGLKFNQAGQDNNSWWSASPAKFNQLSENLGASGLKPVSRPRVLTRSGWPAELYVGNDTNSLKFDCLPLVTNGLIELTGQGFAVAKSASISITNQFNVKTVMEDHGGMVVRMDNADGSMESNVFMITIGVQMVADTTRQQPQDAMPNQSISGRAKIIDKLNHIQLYEFATSKRLTLEEFIRQLSRAAKQADPEQVGVNIISTVFTADRAEDTNSVTIGSVDLRGVTLRDMLDAITILADKPIKYSVMDNEIVFSDNKLITRSYSMDKAVLCEALHKQTGLPIIKAADISWAARNYFSKSGVTLNLPPGKSVIYDDRLGQLIVRATESDLDIIERAIQALIQPASAGRNVNENPLFTTAENMSETGQWVPLTRLDQVGPFVGVSLGEVLRELSEASKRADPAGHGIRFVADSVMDDHPADLNNVFINIPSALKDVPLSDALEAIKQGANKPIKYYFVGAEIGFSAVDKEKLLIRTYRVNLNAFLAGLQQQAGMKLKGNMSLALRNYFTKLGVDMESPPGKSVFYNDRLSLLFVKATEPDLDIVDHFIQLLNQAAPSGQSEFQFSGPQEFSPLPETVAGIVGNSNFRKALHELQKRNTVKELPEPAVVTRSGREANWVDEVSIPLASEDSAESSSQTNPATQLFIRTFKVDTQIFTASLGLKRSPGDFGENLPAAVGPALQKFVTDLGVDLESPSGKTIFFNDKLGLLYVKATESDLDTVGRALQTINMLAPQLHIKARFLEVPKGTFAGLANMIVVTNQPNQLIGVLTSVDFQVALRGLQTRSEELAEPEVVTLSGRQAQVRATELITVVTNFTFAQSSTNLPQNSAPSGASVYPVGQSAIIPQTTQVEIGPVLDVVPYVLSDDYTINLTAIPSLKEFLGYKPLTNTAVSKSLPMSLPVFRNRQAFASLNLWDGQTLVMEAMDPSSSPDSIYSDVPIIGDMPLVGEVFQSRRKTSPPKELLIFVTVTLVDQAGNPVHSDDELPFAKANIPPQPPRPNPSDSNVIFP